MPDSIEELCYNAFDDCRSLTTIRMPNNTYVNKNDKLIIFSLCHKLMNVDLPNESWLPALKGSMFYSEYIKTQNMRKRKNVCIHCGNRFKGILARTCSKCGKPKDY